MIILLWYCHYGRKVEDFPVAFHWTNYKIADIYRGINPNCTTVFFRGFLYPTNLGDFFHQYLLPNFYITTHSFILSWSFSLLFRCFVADAGGNKRICNCFISSFYFLPFCFFQSTITCFSLRSISSGKQCVLRWSLFWCFNNSSCWWCFLVDQRFHILFNRSFSSAFYSDPSFFSISRRSCSVRFSNPSNVHMFIIYQCTCTCNQFGIQTNTFGNWESIGTSGLPIISLYSSRFCSSNAIAPLIMPGFYWPLLSGSGSAW